MEEFRSAASSACVVLADNLFERGIETEILPAIEHGIALTFGYGALCRGLLSGRMRADTNSRRDYG